MELKYLFHNVYGDPDNLIANAPNNVATISFGWDAETENYRIKKLKELNASVSCLPSVLFLHNELWYELRVEDLPRPWSWEQIEEQIQLKINELDNIETP